MSTKTTLAPTAMGILDTGHLIPAKIGVTLKKFVITGITTRSTTVSFLFHKFRCPV
jgi:hypothetical protein